MFRGTALQVLKWDKSLQVSCSPPSPGNFYKESQQAAHPQLQSTNGYILANTVSS